MMTLNGKFTFSNFENGTVTKIELEIKINNQRPGHLMPIQIATNEVLTDDYKPYGTLMGVVLTSVSGTMEIYDRQKNEHLVKSCITQPFTLD